MHSNMFTKIFDTINNYTQDENDVDRWEKFRQGYGPGYSSLTNYMNGEHLEFGLKYDNLATQKSYTNFFYPKYRWYPHDVIFAFAPDVLIDLKLFNERYGNISISNLKNKKKQIELGQVTHIGSWRTWNIGNIKHYELLELTPVREVMNNTFDGGDNFKLYKVKKGLHSIETVV